jgi:putative transposase
VELESGLKKGTDDEADQVHRGADHRGSARARSWREDGRSGSQARHLGISEATLYNWKAKYGGMDVSDAKRLRALEDENRKLKKLLAESMLDQAALKELLTKKW